MGPLPYVTWTDPCNKAAGFCKLYHFKNKFPGTVALAAAVYPAARVEVVDAGVILKPSRPPVAPKLVALP